MTDKKLTQLSTGSAIVDADLFYSAPNAGGQVKQPASALRTYLLGGSGIRTLLTADLDLYVSPTGSDSNTGLTVGSPWLTIQHAFDYIGNTLDMAGYRVIINVANGTYDSAFLQGPVPGSYSGVVLLIPGAVTISGNDIALLYAYYIYLIVAGNGTGVLTLSNASAAATAFFSDDTGYLDISDIDLQFTASATDTDHFYAQMNGRLLIEGNSNVSITGNLKSHMRVANTGTIIRTGGGTTTFNSMPTVGTAFAMTSYNGNMQLLATQTFTGTLTGQKYLAEMGGSIDAFGATLPGTVAGSAGSAGGTTHGFFR